jgi:hypothetical protein
MRPFVRAATQVCIYEHVLDLRSSRMLRSVDWLLVTDVSGEPIAPIFNGQVVFLKCFELFAVLRPYVA